MTNEIQRRLVHATGGVLPLGYVAELYSYRFLRNAFTVGVLAVVLLETLRLSGVADWRLFDRLTREYEQENPAGYALYVVSIAAVCWLFAPEIAVPAALMLTFGDPISGLLGSDERRRVKQSFVLLVMFGVCTLLALPFVGSVAAVAGAVAATAADGATPTVAGYVIDDNLTIPPAAALAMTLVAGL
ncbi:dolichol kinase [Halobacteriales archaeon SW_8_65_20]|nr:MAG: dolichol kinase [Halobacteriales archaeon SW_8_65_20]